MGEHTLRRRDPAAGHVLSRAAGMVVAAIAIAVGVWWFAAREAGHPAPTALGVVPSPRQEQPLEAAADREAARRTPTQERTAASAATGESAGGAAPGIDAVRVVGRVRDARGGRPIPGARITAPDIDPPPAATESDADGGFEIAVVFGTEHELLRAEHDGYLPGQCVLRRRHVRAGRVLTDVVVELTPRSWAATLTGSVRGDHGAPVAGARVGLSHDELGIPDADLPTTTTADDGRFVLEDIVPGTYAVLVESDEYDDYRQVGLELPAGSRTGIGPLELSRYPWARVHGRVTDSTARPLAGVEVLWSVAGRRAAVTAVTDHDGRYGLERLTAGSRGLRFSRPGQWSLSREVTLDPHGDLQLDVVVPTGPHHVGGTVLLDGVAAAGMEVTCALAPASGVEHPFGYLSWSTIVGAAGRFRIDGLPGGPVVTYFEQARPHEFHEAGVIAIDRDDHRFELTTHSGFVTVAGTVRSAADGAPLTGAFVAPWEPHGDEARGVTDPQGTYRIRVLVSDDATCPVEAALPGFVPVWQPVARTSAGADGVVELDFSLEPEPETGAVECAVVDDSDRPLVRASCILRGGPTRRSQLGFTDSRGRVRFAAVPPGDVRLALRHDDFQPAEVTGVLNPGARLELRAAMSPRARHARVVQVTGDGDAPLVGAEVYVWQRGAYSVDGRTDALGTVRFEALPAGTVEISVEHADYARFERRHLIDGPRTHPLPIRLAGGNGRVTGRVVDGRGEGLPRIEVTVRSLPEPGATTAEAVGVRHFVTTDARGEFVLEHIPAGTYHVESWCSAGTRDAEVTVSRSSPSPAPVILAYD